MINLAKSICGVLILGCVLSTPAQRSSTGRRYPQLVKAAERGDVKTVRALIREGVKTDPSKRGGWTALMSAASAGHIEVVRVLLAAGADPNAVKITIHAVAFTPVICALESHADNRLEIVDLLIANGATLNQGDISSPLLRGIVREDMSVIEALLARGADVNLRFFEGFTPLMVAVDKESIRLVKRLIAAGSDINAKNNKGESALSIAQQHGRMDIAELLKQAGAK